MKDNIPLEKTITNDIIKWLKGSGYPFVVKIHGSAFQSSGLPDIITIASNGRFVGLEVKRPRIGKLTKLQEGTLDRINQAGGYGMVVRSVDDAKCAMRRACEGDSIQERKGSEPLSESDLL